MKMEWGKFCNIADDFTHGKNFQCGSFVKIEKNVIVGDDVSIGDYVLLKSGVRLGNHVEIKEYVMLMSGSRIGDNTSIGNFTKIGENAIIGVRCQLISFCEIRDACNIGNNVLMGSRGTLSAHAIVEDDVVMKYSFVVTDTPDLAREEEKKVGVIRKGSRFGTNVCIMPGVNIGENVEIGACSQVRHDVPANEIWYGNPARFMKKRNS